MMGSPRKRTEVVKHEPTDDELFDAFIDLLNEGNEEMAVMVYCGVLPIPEAVTRH
jgi:hypothetical protein